MDEAALLSGLIGDIYDAALDPSLWPGVLGRAARFVGGWSATLFSKDANRKTGHIYYDDGGIDPRYTQLYFETYVKLDPATTGHYFAELEEPMSTADIVPYQEFLDSRMYREWARPQGLVDFASAVLEKSATSVAMFGVFRHKSQGIVDDEMRTRMRLIVPHIRRAMLIGNAIDLKTAEAATFADTFDELTAGMLLVDANGRIVHANAAAHVLLAAGDVLRAADGRLAAGDLESDGILRDIFSAADKGDAAIGIKGIAVPLTARDGERYVAHVLPLTSGTRRRAASAYRAAAAVFVHKAAMHTPAPPEVIAKHYKLTPTELRVLLAIVEVGGVPEVAEALGVAETTVKTHLGRLYEKTGTRRQAELVKLVAGFSNPLVG
jgi:DNA-binding CsgD family transcriptional regulator/PAS domain-containing protein